MTHLIKTLCIADSHEYDVLRGRYNACYLWEEPTDASSRLLGMIYYPFTDEDYSPSNPNWNGNELEAQGHNKAYLFHWDTNKNITHVTDEKDKIVAHYDYSAFGRIVTSEGDFADSQPFRFSCEYYDKELGLLSYNYRFYNPLEGRFLSRDPIGESGGYNLYAFCNNDPINHTDHLGLKIDLKQAPQGVESQLELKKSKLKEMRTLIKNNVSDAEFDKMVLKKSIRIYTHNASTAWENSYFTGSKTEFLKKIDHELSSQASEAGWKSLENIVSYVRSNSSSHTDPNDLMLIGIHGDVDDDDNVSIRFPDGSIHNQLSTIQKIVSAYSGQSNFYVVSCYRAYSEAIKMNEKNPSVVIPDLGTTIESMNFQLSSGYIWVDDPNKICKINLYTFYAYARRPNMEVKNITFDIIAKKGKTK